MNKSAILSRCGLYRYELKRNWGKGPSIDWIMLNPSTADHEKDDATIRRCMGFARDWNYSGICVYNLYAYRASVPENLQEAEDPVGKHNDEVLKMLPKGPIVCAWGGWAFRWTAPRVESVLALLKGRELLCLGQTNTGNPRHPLYLAANTELRPLCL
jgi:hypothetical protein